jgi:hypothetical protein
MLERQTGQEPKRLIPIPVAGGSETIMSHRLVVSLEEIAQYLVLRPSRKQE